MIRTINLEKKKIKKRQNCIWAEISSNPSWVWTWKLILEYCFIICQSSAWDDVLFFFFLLFSRELIFLLTGQKSFAICELMGGSSLKRKCWQRLTQNFQPLWHKLQRVNIYLVLFLHYWPRQRSKWKSSSIIQTH